MIGLDHMTCKHLNICITNITLVIIMTSEEKKAVTIRGIDKKIYNKLASLAKELDKSVGDLINDAMALVLTLRGKLEDVRSDILLIDGVDNLELTGKELEEVDKKVLILNVDELTLSRDVNTNHVKEKIHRLINVNKLRVMGSVNKLVLYSKCINVKEIIFEGEGSTAKGGE